MISPFDLLLDPVSLTVFGLYAGLIIWEALFPARELPPVRQWRIRGIAAFTVYFFISSYLPMIWSDQLSSFQLIDLSGLGILGGTLIGLLIYELGIYVWHRTMHESDLLWRSFHQMHHSAERLDSYGAFFFSPLDMIGFTIVFSLSFTLIGFDAASITMVLYITTFMGVFQHTNVRTPQWLGYFIQRPESHSMHHGRGIHKNNYSDLPLFDILFGTFQNPKTFAAATGFYDGASERIGDMLIFKDVTMPASAREQASVSAR